VIFVEVQF